MNKNSAFCFPRNEKMDNSMEPESVAVTTSDSDGTSVVTFEATYSQPFDVMWRRTIVIPLFYTPTIISQSCKLLPRYLNLRGKRARDVLQFFCSQSHANSSGKLFTNRIHSEKLSILFIPKNVHSE